MTREEQLIAALTRPPRDPAVRVGIGDDAAVLADGTVLTVDAMVEGVHWDDKLTPEDVGWKLVAVNASDLGAMGARPTWALLTLALPNPLDLDWARRFRDGLHAALDHFGLELVGGDTVAAPTRMVTLTVGGRAARPVLRSTGRPGDDLWVTGALGLAAEGFLLPAPSPEARRALARPEPPVRFGAALGEAGLATAMMDLSDGLREDLGRLCRASDVGAWVDPAAVPGAAALAHRFAFGEDYQLLFAAPPEARSAVESLAASHGATVSRIGALEHGREARLIGTEWPPALFTHFPTAPAAPSPTTS